MISITRFFLPPYLVTGVAVLTLYLALAAVHKSRAIRPFTNIERLWCCHQKHVRSDQAVSCAQSSHGYISNTQWGKITKRAPTRRSLLRMKNFPTEHQDKNHLEIKSRVVNTREPKNSQYSLKTVLLKILL